MSTGAPSTVDIACDAIRSAIRNGTLAGGDRIREVDMCEIANVSRTSVRQALTLLAAEGLVELRPNRGAMVIDWTAPDQTQIFDLRAILEGYGASLAASRATPHEVDQISLEALSFHDLIRKGKHFDLRLVSESNNRLHRLIQDAGRSPRLNSLLAGVIHAPLVLQTFAKYSRESLERSAMQHLDVASAIKSHDAAWAEAAMRAHIHGAKKVIFGE